MPVRLLQPRDHEQWLRLRQRLWPECPPERHLIEMKDLLTSRNRKAVFVCDRGRGELSGFLEVSLRESLGDSTSPVVGYIEGWYVLPGRRRQGTGQALLRAAQQWALARGITELSSCTEVRNTASIAAHLRLGFEESFRLVHFLKTLKPHNRRRKTAAARSRQRRTK